MKNTLRIIISPAKKNERGDRYSGAFGNAGLSGKANTLKGYVQSLTYEEAKKLWGCNDKLAELNFGRFQGMDLTKNLTRRFCPMRGSSISIWRLGCFGTDSGNMCRSICGFCPVLRGAEAAGRSGSIPDGNGSTALHSAE